MASYMYLIFSFLNLVVAHFGLEIPLNDRARNASLDVDGLWPTVSVLYGSGQDRIDCHMTFWTESIFVLEQQCPVSDYHMLCPKSTASPKPAPKQPPDIAQKVNMTKLMLDASQGTAMPEVGNLLSVLHVNGESDRGMSDIEVADTPQSIAQVIGDSLAVWPSHLAKRLPLWESLLSLRDISSRLRSRAAVRSNLIGLHLGSIEPRMPGSLHIGAYDDFRIMGDLLNFSSFASPYDSQFGIFSVCVGVEKGFLPLEKLTSDTSGFPTGPYATDRHTFRDTTNSTAANVKLEPGTPYMHLPYEICDSLAGLLDLTYEPERNIYLWNYEASHHLFHSPAYLEFVLGAGSGVGSLLALHNNPDYERKSVSYATVKIPFALLRPSFRAAADSETGKHYPRVAYFPCSPIDPQPDANDYIWNGKSMTSTLGRAFLQAAFVGIRYHDDELQTATYWVAQAPGPANLSKRVVDADDGGGIPFANRTLPPTAWTESWSEVLPICTIDADGKTTLAERMKSPPILTKSEKIVTGVVGPLGTLAIGLLIYLCWTSHMQSRRRWKEIQEDVAKENEIARKRESVARDRQRARTRAECLRRSAGNAPAPGEVGQSWQEASASTVIAAVSEDADAISSATARPQEGVVDSRYTIPRKPLPQQ